MVQAGFVQLETGAIDYYETPVMPPCPDGREAEFIRAAQLQQEDQPPRTLPVSIHQAQQEYYKRFPARTEAEWDALKATRQLDEAELAESSFSPLGASRAGPFTLQKQVFGWHPSWEGSGYTNYSFDLLSTVAYFSYEVNPSTGYAYTMYSWSNTPLVEWAHSSGVEVVLSATLFSGHSTFFGSATAQSNLISELIRVVQLRNADGVNIDFESIPSGYRAQLTAFMSNLATRMHASIPGSQVSICLPAVDWSSNFDVAAFDTFLDLCIMMGYDYNWRTGPNAGPVAPLKSSTVFGSYCVMRSVSNYLAAGLSPERFLVGVPYYGYEWPAASSNLYAATTGSGTARVYSVATSRAATYGRQWDTNSLTPYFTHGSYVQCWYEDTNSLGAKYDFFESKNLGGIGIWALGYDDQLPDLWDLIAEKYAAGESPEPEEEGDLAVTPAPGGALSNIVVYCSAGHGFCADTSSGGWYVGRALVNNVVEDMGNIDQLNTFAQYCLNAGATVIPMRPVGYQTNEVVLDNDDAGVTYTGTWYNSSYTIFYGSAGDTPYRYAYIATNGATAGARYTPNLPTAGFYPVYTWVLHSANRVRQLYRIRHSGGISEIRVNHRRVGAGWVWLGTYHFEAGSGGYVEISNDAPGYTPASDVIIADAIRFGNGMGDINRGWGVSGYEKELEASRYWVQGMTGQGMSSDLYDRPTLDDNDDNVGAPIRMADYMDDETDGDFWDRIYLGFHSNADGGAGALRGPQGLYNTDNTVASQARQQAFAQALANAITNDFAYLDNGVGFNDPWANNSANLYGAVYGELSEAYNSNMNSTIIEVAFHNNADDAKLLRDPSARQYFSRSCLKGLVRHLNANNSSVPLVFLPDPPTTPRAINAPGGVTLSWLAPQTNIASGGAATSYRVYQSTNGYGFGAALATTNTTATLTNLTAGMTYFFRVTALNAGGESLPSEVVAARRSASGRAYHLVVNGFDRFDRSLSPTRYFGANILGNVTMVRPRRINSFDYAVQHGQAIAAADRYFDSCAHGAIASDLVRLTNYHAAYWILGEESTTNETFGSAEQSLVQTFLSNGGCLFVSGAELGWDLGNLGSAADRNFLTNYLRVAYAADASNTNRATGAGAGIFSGLGTLPFDDGSGNTYRVEYADVFRSQAGSVTAMVYGSSSSGANAAAIQFSNAWRTVVLGFPFETITDAAYRTNVMKRVLDFFGFHPGELETGSGTNLIDEPFDAAPASPAGWTFSGVSSYTTASASGRNPPSVKFDDGGDWIMSPWFCSGSNLVFFMKAYPASGANSIGSFVVEQYQSGSWSALSTFTDPVNIGTTQSLALAATVTRLRFTWNKTSGNIAFDDVIVTGPVTDPDSDVDGDGLPDRWELEHFTNGLDSAASGDEDEDGATNWQEWIAGTDPGDAESVLEVNSDPSAHPVYMVITWPSVEDRRYTVRWTTNLLNSLNVLSNNIAATPPLNTFTDTTHSVEMQLYYRVSVTNQ